MTSLSKRSPRVAEAPRGRATRSRCRRFVAALACWCGWLAFIDAGVSFADDVGLTAMRAHVAILDLALEDARAILDGAGDDPATVVERARLAIYRGDCDGAVALLDRADLREHDGAAELAPIATGCARVTAAAVLRRDDRGVVVRFQDAADASLFPLIVDAALRIRETLTRDLGSRLPDPIFVDMVRDQLSLSAMSGLPERAAKTTGTVAVAKWGRVLILSPRAAPDGYGWLDTLAHEMTHLVLSMATRDRAPLWLQEGVAKREETRWRQRHPFDGIPSPDDVASVGMERGLGLSLTGLGPSIAMLPSAEQAMVAFAQVSSFVAYWVDASGDAALPKLLTALRDAPPLARPEEAIPAVGGATLEEWERRWKAWLATQPHSLPEEIMGGRLAAKGHVVSFREVARKRRVAELLLGRGHAEAARVEARRAGELVPTDAGVRCVHADAWLATGAKERAAELVSDPKQIRMPTARWWSLHAAFGGSGALPDARSLALASDPYDPHVACEELGDGALPGDAIRRELCVAARRHPWQ